MTGPWDDLFGFTPFDLNRDGKIDAAEYAFLEEVFEEELREKSVSDEDDEEDEFDDI